ncbi:MAG: cysteine desulfurase [Clostridia bacterium]|nr:cysteine desulfurase [Clostridia bacterium]
MIYLDNAATTPIDNEVLQAMLPYLKENFGNSSSQHSAGRVAANAVLYARDKIAKILGCPAEEVYFTSGGTEAGNFALKGVCAAKGHGHIIVAETEHPAILESAKDMQKLGFAVSYLLPDENGIISPSAIKSEIRRDTVFCSVMHANNETGVIQPVEKIGKACKERGVFYYCDCVQSAGVLPFPTEFCDGLGISAHKFYGPKGIGAIRIKNGAKISRFISGGRQESGLRGGTVNVAAVVGMATALEKAVQDSEVNNKKIAAVRDWFVKRVLTEIDGTQLNGDNLNRVPSNANISFDGCDGENLLFLLDLKGVCVSTGSACSAGAVSPSHVLKAMWYKDERAKSAVRFTFGKYNTKAEADKTVEYLKAAVAKIRGGKG